MGARLHERHGFYGMDILLSASHGFMTSYRALRTSIDLEINELLSQGLRARRIALVILKAMLLDRHVATECSNKGSLESCTRGQTKKPSYSVVVDENCIISQIPI